jgi:hypothetical protein
MMGVGAYVGVGDSQTDTGSRDGRLGAGPDTWKWRSKARKMLLRDRRAEGRTGAVLGKGKQPIVKVAMTAEERRQTSGKFLISEEDSGHFQVIMGKVS